MRVAIVHDWLLGMRGGERCLEVICGLFPDAELFTAFYDPSRISDTINRHPVHVSALRHLPEVRRYHRYLLPLYPLAARSLARALENRSRGSQFDLVLSVSHCLAKNVAVPEGSCHISYCLTPMRYIWDQYDAYFGGKKLEPAYRIAAHQLRRWDVARSSSVQRYIAISHFVRRRIKEVYGREADVIYPPVRTEWITPRAADDVGDGFLCVNALVPYKNVDLIVRAFTKLPHRLTIVGAGPERGRLERMAGKNITFLEGISDEKLASLYGRSKALIFAAEEDFGMTPIEMQAAGRPVIAYGSGGALETVVAEGSVPTGVFFNEPTEEALCEAVEEFLRRQQEFTVDNCVSNSNLFSCERFQEELLRLLAEEGFELPLPVSAGQRVEQRAAGF